MGIVISPLVGLIEEQVGACMMHVVSVCCKACYFKASQLLSRGVPAIHAFHSEHDRHKGWKVHVWLV